MVICKFCDQPFEEVKALAEVLLSTPSTRLAFAQQKLARQERLFDKLVRRDHGEGTPEQRQKAREVVAGIVRTFSVEPKLRRRI
jgi:hypothetical protein